MPPPPGLQQQKKPGYNRVNQIISFIAYNSIDELKKALNNDSIKGENTQFLLYIYIYV